MSMTAGDFSASKSKRRKKAVVKIMRKKTFEKKPVSQPESDFEFVDGLDFKTLRSNLPGIREYFETTIDKYNLKEKKLAKDALKYLDEYERAVINVEDRIEEETMLAIEQRTLVKDLKEKIFSVFKNEIEFTVSMVRAKCFFSNRRPNVKKVEAAMNTLVEESYLKKDNSKRYIKYSISR